MDEMQCNIVVMKRSQAKVLRLNLVGSPKKGAEKESPLPIKPEAASEKHKNNTCGTHHLRINASNLLLMA